MNRTIACVLNGENLRFESPEGRLTVDWLRRDRGLTGTKEGCREGDCGACLVLLGGPSAEDQPGVIEWLAVPSCLLALGELDGRHLVTIEGIAAAGPTPVMTALHGEGASQCGFCSPGIVVALTAFLLGGGNHDAAAAMAAVDGNLCRCTGYASIRRAAAKLSAYFAELPLDFSARLASLAASGVVPPSLAATMGGESLPKPVGSRKAESPRSAAALILGGGTDWFVRHPDGESESSAAFVDRDPSLRRIVRAGGDLRIGAAVTEREFFAAPLVRNAIPGIEAYERLIASAPIRARATLAGNIANASPVGDMTAMLIALGARLSFRGAGPREVPLERFFLAYKKIDLREDESIEAILIPVGSGGAAHAAASAGSTEAGAGGSASAGSAGAGAAFKRTFFSFEKASKRANLDIASVNSALACELEGGSNGDGRGVLRSVRLSAGGVGPTPLFLAEASRFLEGKRPDAPTVKEAAELAVAACAPQSDVRGSASYRSALVRRFVYAHFIRMAPDSGLAEELFP